MRMGNGVAIIVLNRCIVNFVYFPIINNIKHINIFEITYLYPIFYIEFVWELEDKVSLIDSIFNNVDIGKFTFLHYDDQRWTETGFGYEIIDGKQRLRTILDFYEDRFAYKGRLFSELSHRDRNHFKNYPIMEAELHNLTREQILRYFIMLNTGGRIMAKEQIDKVRGMLENL